MKKVSMILRLAGVLIILGGLSAFAAEKQPPPDSASKAPATSEGPKVFLKVPVLSDRFTNVPVATVNDDVITVGDLGSALVSTHEGSSPATTQTKKVDFGEMLGRLVNLRLIVQEGRNMGLDELPAVKQLVSDYSKGLVRALLIEDLQKEAKADDAEVEKYYKELIKEWKIKSLMFHKEEDANKMEEEMKAGKSFDELMAKAIDGKLAEGSKEGGWVKPGQLLPGMAEMVAKMNKGDVSPVIKILQGGKLGTGYAILKFEDERFVDDAAAKKKATEGVLAAARVEAVKDFKRKIEKGMKIDFKLIRGIDYEAPKPGFEALLKDKRVIVKVKRGKPVTVADLSQGLKEKYFHGIQEAIKSKQVNKAKLEVLDQILEKRIFREEASRRHIEESAQFKKAMREYEDSVIFGFFVQKAIMPDIKVSEDEKTAYYADHKKDFTYPEMMKLDDLVFGKMGDAESAVAKLREGADFKWMKSNTEGQLPKDTKGLLSFDGQTYMVNQLPEDIQKALSGARSGDARLYQGPEGQVYVLYLQQLVPSRTEPFDNVKDEISKQIYNKKLNKSVEEWADKLKEQAVVHVYLTGADSQKAADKAN